MTPLTPAVIAELRRLLAAATPGPWEADLDGNANGEPLIYGQTRDWWIATLHPQCLGSLEALRLADAALIVALRNAAPALLDAADEAERLLLDAADEAERLRTETDELRARLADAYAHEDAMDASHVDLNLDLEAAERELQRVLDSPCVGCRQSTDAMIDAERERDEALAALSALRAGVERSIPATFCRDQTRLHGPHSYCGGCDLVRLLASAPAALAAEADLQHGSKT